MIGREVEGVMERAESCIPRHRHTKTWLDSIPNFSRLLRSALHMMGGFYDQWTNRNPPKSLGIKCVYITADEALVLRYEVLVQQ